MVLWSGLSGKVYVSDPEKIPDTVDAVMNCIQSGDWTDLENLVVGEAALVPNTGQEGSAEQLIYFAYQESLHWHCKDSLQIHGPYVSQTISVSCLDIHRLTSAVSALLSETDTAYSLSNSENQLRLITEQILIEYIPIAEHDLTLVFLKENGNWYLVPDAALQTLLSGFTIT
jgi:hypothetical protein